jgi:hypothetical protein
VAEPRLLLRQIGGGYIVLPNAVHVSIETTARKLGVVLPRIILPADVAREAGDSVEILFQPNPREQRTVPGVAKIIEAKTQQGQTCYVVQVFNLKQTKHQRQFRKKNTHSQFFVSSF